MLIKCPKCDFTQPQDRYCAKCGVDIENFAPKKASVRKRIFDHPALYILIAFVCFVIAVIFVRQHQKADMASRVQFLKGGPVVAKRQTLEGQQASSVPPPPPHLPSTAAATANLASVTPGEDSENLKVHVLYAEVDHETMETLRAESLLTRQQTDFGDFKAGALPAKVHPSRERGVRVLEKIDRVYEKNSLSQQWFVGQKNSEGEEGVGLTTLLALENATGSTIRGEVEFLLAAYDSNEHVEGPVRRNFPSTSFELSPGMSWMVTLRVPAVAQDEPGGVADGFMRIFQSAQYKSRQTEFTLFIVFDTPGSNSGKN